MAYLGTPPRSRVLSSADIDPGSISLDDISFTDQPTNLDITGTYDKHTMRLADGVTVVGDVTISDNLILSKISDDGNAITLTNDSSTRTITGTGSLEASTLTQTPNASLTGMTGELGSVVTGSPNLNLGNATFPAGHVIQAKESINTYATAVVGTSYTDVLSSSGTTWEPEITTSSSSSKVLAIFHLPLTAIRNGSNDGRGHYEIHQKIGSANYVSMLQQYDAVGTYDYGGSGIWSASPVTLNRLFSPGSAAVIKYKIRIAAQSSVTVRFGPDSTSEDQRHGFVTLMEVSG